jgi:hypothetical protein
MNLYRDKKMTSPLAHSIAFATDLIDRWRSGEIDSDDMETYIYEDGVFLSDLVEERSVQRALSPWLRNNGSISFRLSIINMIIGYASNYATAHHNDENNALRRYYDILRFLGQLITTTLSQR